MDIDLLSKMVKELILDNDRVVLPGLGAFVAEIVPSTFSDKGYTINPPYRRMFFRIKPDEGDELALLYARGNNVEKMVAERIIKDFVAELKTILHSRKTVVFPGLGRLRATKENNIFFVADEDLDIYPAGFGLEPISLKTHQETREEVSAAMQGLKSMLLEPGPQSQPQPEPEPQPEPASMQETVSQPGIVPEPMPIEGPVSTEELISTEKPASSAEPVSVPQLENDIKEEAALEKKPSNAGRTLLIVSGIMIALIILLLAALAIAGRTNPEWVDNFLYTQEELRILNQTL